MRKIECSTLVLDLDGTISDPGEGICRCFNYAIESHGIPPVPENLILAEIGPPLDEMFAKLSPAIPASDMPKLIARYRERYAETGYAENEIFPGIPQVLQRIHSMGLKMGVCTSKRRDFAEKILKMFGLLEYFSFVDGGDIGVKKMAQLAGLLSSGAIDSRAVMVGDRAVDILSAQANGLRSIGVLWGFGSLAEIAEAEPTLISATIGEFDEQVTGDRFTRNIFDSRC